MSGDFGAGLNNSVLSGGMGAAGRASQSLNNSVDVGHYYQNGGGPAAVYASQTALNKSIDRADINVGLQQ